MKKILLIEDNHDVRENTAEILSLANYHVVTAVNGREGVELAQKETPDLIICDIMMPVLDGYGVLHLLSKNEKTADIPFIFLTAKTERADIRRGMDMGADDYLTKPFEDSELLSAIESRLKKSDSLKRNFQKDLGGLNEFLESARSFDDLKQISRDNDIKEFKKKEEIYKEGGNPKGVFFLHRGKVKTYRTNEQGKEFITGLYTEGDFFGYHALIEDGQYNDAACALEDSEICMLTREDFFSLLYRNAAVSRKFIRMIASDLQDKEAQLVKLAYNSVRKRVADALTTLYNRYKKDSDPGFRMSLSREDLANLAGTATETTIRTLSDFKDEGLVDVKGSMISILDFEKLSKLKN